MLPVRHNWPQLEMGGSMHTNATKASAQDAGIHHSTERHEGLTLFSCGPCHKGLGHSSTMGIHNSIGGSQAVTTQVTSLSKW